jgi:hypothetical protein
MSEVEAVIPTPPMVEGLHCSDRVPMVEGSAFGERTRGGEKGLLPLLRVQFSGVSPEDRVRRDAPAAAGQPPDEDAYAPQNAR